ncbi:MAG: uroporphyrinogen decarboxylase family protein [Thermoproteota archaeon]|nr:hypothetical protein [Candidatus Brockarchaeota archaeon]MBO3801878.1 hypothetical protein [Candidatus Brockarchaeota archaeon]
MEPFNYYYYIRLAEENRKRIEKVSKFEEPDRVPIVIGVGGPYYAKLFGYTFAEYYNNLEVMLDTQIRGIKWRFNWLKDDITHIGISLDLGSISEGIVFNCKIDMPCKENPWKSPWTIPCIKSLEDIDKLEVPDPYSHKGIKEYYSKLEKLKELVKRNYGDLPVGGMLQIHPPVSAAGSLMGPERLYTWLYKYPNEMHKLFKKLEETFKVLQDYYYSMTKANVGNLGLADDHSGYLSRKMYEKFTMPYNLHLYELYGTRYRSLHMDSHMDHIADILVNVYKINEVDVGVENDIRSIANVFKGKVLFNGNANWRVLLKDSFEEIELEVERCIYYAAPGGGYIFDNGGETYVGIPPDRLKYEVEYAKKVGKYPIKKEKFRHLNKFLVL